METSGIEPSLICDNCCHLERAPFTPGDTHHCGGNFLELEKVPYRIATLKAERTKYWESAETERRLKDGAEAQLAVLVEVLCLHKSHIVPPPPKEHCWCTLQEIHSTDCEKTKAAIANLPAAANGIGV